METVIELEIGAGPTAGTYVVDVVRSLAGGEPSATIELDVDAMVAGLPQLESSVLASSVSTRRVMTTGESAVQSIGVHLFESVFQGKVREAYRASTAVAVDRGLAPQVILRLTAPQLAVLPWEALFDSEVGRYISRKEPLVRRVSAPYTADPPLVTPPLRILGIVSAPRGLPPLDVDLEKERLEAALEEQVAEGRVELVWLEDVTWGGIHDKLLREPWHVLHFIGHGAYDVQADEGLVALVGQDGRADFVSASKLADLLMEAESTPRLVVLNSCQSGATGSSDLFAGTAATLVHGGIHAVVAMQFSVTDYAALAFSRSFYVALATGRSIGEAVRSGRIGILGTARDTLEWITPVLYLREDDAQLLDMVAPVRRPAPAPDPRPVAPPPPEAGAGNVAEPSTDPRRKVRWLLWASVLVAVLLVGGLTWVTAVRLGGIFAVDDPTPAPTPIVSPTTLPAVLLAIPAAAYWTTTGISCAEGDVLSITATGTILHDLNPNSIVTPDGLLTPEGLPDPNYLPYNVPGVPEVATASLIGSLDMQEPFAVGSNKTYTCPRAGQLFLGINDSGLEGNSGAWDVTVVKTDNPPLD